MITTMKEHPILFSAPMVRAILESRKTVTRRVVKPQASAGVRRSPFVQSGIEDGHGRELRSRYGQPGDRLWVRETWAETDRPDGTPVVAYRAGGSIAVGRKAPDNADFLLPTIAWDDTPTPDRWRPAIHMFRWASRITLEVTTVRVERLQAITHEQAIAEGVHVVAIGSGYLDRYSAAPVAWSDVVEGTADAYKDARLAFRDLWDGINAAHGFSWAANPWVWVVEFKRIEATA